MGPPAGFDPDAFPDIATERLVLRPLRPADAADYHRLINDWQVARNLARVPFPYPRADADSWIAFTREALADGRALQLAIVGRDHGNETLVGSVGLRRTEPGQASLGYWVGRPYWGHGVATEAAGRLARWALANTDLLSITAYVIEGNDASMAVLRRVGFREAGSAMQEFLALGGEHPVRLFAATREDLFGRPAAPSAATSKILLVAACALVDADGRVLLARRPEGKPMAGLWEFPGGKVRPEETPEAALIRELNEELGIDVSAACLAPFTFASHAYADFHLLMPLYLCRRWQGTLIAREGQRLAWVRPARLAEYPMPEADKPLVPLLRDFL